MTRSADVVIVGGGVIGVSIAFHLACSGAGRILVLERRFVASGATGRSVGIVRQLYPTLETSRMVRRSLDVFLDFTARVGGDAGYVTSGVLISVSPAMRSSLEKSVAVQADAGIDAHLLEPDEIVRVEPRVDPSGLGAAIWEPQSGYADPTAVAHGYAGAARRRCRHTRRRPHRGAGGRERRWLVVAVRRRARRDRPADRHRPPPCLPRRARRRLRASSRRISGSCRRKLRAAGDRRSHDDRLTHRRRDPPSDGPGAARRGRRARRGDPGSRAHGTRRTATRRRHLPTRLCRRIRHHARLDADHRRIAASRVLRRRRHERPRLQARAGRRRNDGRAHHRDGVAGQPHAVQAAGSFVASYLG
ncbi:MAG: hypothetical protein DMD81_23765 [Candidatus Rokuibacteriota bacterium]|nr:MAG: hypothetical protein DMD81_23765 [Candidatus Rokubacteria bacterium]